MSISEQVKELRTLACVMDFKEWEKAINRAADTIESLSAKLQAANMERSAENCGGGWIKCIERLPDKEVLCCDKDKNMIFGYVFVDEESETGFSAENDHEFMYNCVKWMEKPKP